MRILVYSDLHNEYNLFIPPVTNPDVIVLAGDIHNGVQGALWAQQYLPKDIPIIYVQGNHEYYDHHFPINLEQLKAVTVGTNIHVLDMESVLIGNVEFFGCTLWTALNLNGNIELAKLTVAERMNDYRYIKHAELGLINPELIRQYHQQSFTWLQRALAQSVAPYKVVVTHHAPSKKSVTEDFLASETAVGYVTELDSFIVESGIDLWIHGHTHQKIDYHIGKTRVVSNPRGYRSKHHLKFNPTEIVVLDNEF